MDAIKLLEQLKQALKATHIGIFYHHGVLDIYASFDGGLDSGVPVLLNHRGSLEDALAQAMPQEQVTGLKIVKQQ